MADQYGCSYGKAVNGLKPTQHTWLEQFKGNAGFGLQR